MVTASRPAPAWLQSLAEPARLVRGYGPPPALEPSRASLPTRKRVLLIAYSFPPVGGAGVQRPAKWVKYLDQFGWDVTVLTVENPSVPLLDESLLAEIPATTRIVKARTLEPSYRFKQAVSGNVGSGVASSRGGLLKRGLRSITSWAKKLAKSCATTLLQPDAQRLWLPAAWKVACQTLRETPHDAILVTAPPYSSFLLGQRLKARFGLPLVLDYRDEWDLSSRYLENSATGWFARQIQERMQRGVLRSADAVITTTQSSSRAIRQRLAALGLATHVETIYNGFDTDDFASGTNSTTSQPAPANKPAAGIFRLIYTGTLWNLTDITPVVKAIESVAADAPELAKHLEFLVVGRKTPEQRQVLDRLVALPCRVILRDYCPHAEVLEHQSQADSLLLLLSDVPGADRVVPAKLFEYLATRKEILAVVPQGETAGIVREFHAESQFTPADYTGIAHWILERLQRAAGQTIAASSTMNPAFPEQRLLDFSRKSQTSQLAGLLSEVANAGQGAAAVGGSR